MVVYSQLAALPNELPFNIVSKTIGQGAYACIKKAQLPGQSQVFAVKFIHKAYAMRHGGVSAKQLDLEITLHKHLGRHAHIVQFFQAGEDPNWRWIAMELAEGGDLFDKIESDVGIGEEISHVYFTQLISAIGFMHDKGVGHRDIKPENILLSLEGELKIADFGLATLFKHKDQRKICKHSAGSPPYTAPEVVLCTPATAKQGLGYYGDRVDIWSCGVVLFVLLVGNTPWDEPTERSVEFHDYATSEGKPPGDELWNKLPADTISLLRGMMNLDSELRFSLADVQRHPWYNRPNPYLHKNGTLANPVALATEMFETMHIDFSQDPMASQRSMVPNSPDAMELDDHSHPRQAPLDTSNLKTPTAEIQFDWETQLPASQQVNGQYLKPTQPSSSLENRLQDEPFCSQFAPQAAVPLSRTQFARRFADILPAHSLTRFVSTWDLPDLLAFLAEALAKLNVPVAKDVASGVEGEAAYIKIRTRDGRNCLLSGELVVERMRGDNGEIVGSQVCFVKVTGDPVEWRRLFKKVVQLCQVAVWKPE